MVQICRASKTFVHFKVGISWPWTVLKTQWFQILWRRPKPGTWIIIFSQTINSFHKKTLVTLGCRLQCWKYLFVILKKCSTIFRNCKMTHNKYFLLFKWLFQSDRFKLTAHFVRFCVSIVTNENNTNGNSCNNARTACFQAQKRCNNDVNAIMIMTSKWGNAEKPITEPGIKT